MALVATIDQLDPERLDKVIDVNLKGTFNLIKACIPVFRRQGSGGNIVLISSKNVFDPGKAFGAYSASKAGAHQLGKIAALELAEIGIKVNMINPDAVFSCEEVSSQLWDLVGPDRMRSRGLDPSCMADYYRERNLLKDRGQRGTRGQRRGLFRQRSHPHHRGHPAGGRRGPGRFSPLIMKYGLSGQAQRPARLEQNSPQR